MKNTILIVLAVLLAVAVIGVRAQSPAAGGPAPQGRFQLYQMDFTFTADNVSNKTTSVFRVDTTTGETVYFLSHLKGGKLTEQWVKIAEDRR